MLADNSGSLLKIPTISQTFTASISSNAVIQGNLTASIASDAVIQGNLTASISSNALIQANLTASIVSNAIHPENVPVPIVVKLGLLVGRVTVCKFIHPVNIPELKVSTELGIVITCKLVQLKKIDDPKIVILVVIFAVTNLTQFLNVKSFTVVKVAFVGNTTFVIFIQPSNI
jgi:hypothetical protein